MRKAGWKIATFVAIAGVVVALLMPVVPLAFQAGSSTSRVHTGNPKKDLAVSPKELVLAQVQCVSNKFLPNSLASKANEKKFAYGDSMSTPYTTRKANEELQEQLAEDCGNPVVLREEIEAAYTVPVDGTTLGAINGSWARPFLRQIHMKGITSFMYKKSGKFFMTSSYEEVAELYNSILLRMHNSGNMSMTSLSNWHVAGRSGLAAGTIPVATPNSVQEQGREALVLSYTDKTGCSEVQFGFNVLDKRFESFALPNCATPHPSTSSAPSSSSTPSTPSTGCTSNCGSTIIVPLCPNGKPKNADGGCGKDTSLDPPRPAYTAPQGADADQTGTGGQTGSGLTTGAGTSSTINTSGSTGSNGQTGSQDPGSSVHVSGATPVATPTSTPGPNQGTAGTSTSHIGGGVLG